MKEANPTVVQDLRPERIIDKFGCIIAQSDVIQSDGKELWMDVSDERFERMKDRGATFAPLKGGLQLVQ